MECPICFMPYDSYERIPLRAFCKCKKTLCLVCIENMVNNSSVCPWDKTRWSGRNLMQKFYNNTPDGYLDVIRRESEQQDGELVVRHSVLGPGELRNEFLRQQELERRRIQAQHAEQLEKDKELAMLLARENEERLAQLQRIEQEDLRYAQSLLANENSNNNVVIRCTGAVNKPNIIKDMLLKQGTRTTSRSNGENRFAALSSKRSLSSGGSGSSIGGQRGASVGLEHFFGQSAKSLNVKPQSLSPSHNSSTDRAVPLHDSSRQRSTNIGDALIVSTACRENIVSHARYDSGSETDYEGSSHAGSATKRPRVDEPEMPPEPPVVDSQETVWDGEAAAAENLQVPPLPPLLWKTKTSVGSGSSIVDNVSVASEWACPSCTYLNIGSVQRCEMCQHGAVLV